MQINPKGVHHLDTDRLHRYKLNVQLNSIQHGYRSKHSLPSNLSQGPSPLLDLPSETLTHVTAFLDPQSLLSLGRTNRVLREHVEDDNTWRSAFSCQFLGQSPGHPEQQECPLLRRTENTWKKEYIARRNLLWRWERSRNGMVTHQPFLPAISSFHVLSDRSHGPALLSTALQYGLVARSSPLTGKVLKRYITPSDGNGFGFANPNVHILGEVTASSVCSEGWTARVVWGFASGEVTLAIANRVMEHAKMSYKIVTCRIGEQHRGRVVDVVWDGDRIVTGSVDGEVRVWDAKRMRCLLVLKDQDVLSQEPCKHVLSDLKHGYVITTKGNGTVLVWDKIVFSEDDTTTSLQYRYPSVRICSPHADEAIKPSPERVFLDHKSNEKHLMFGIHYAEDPYFYGISVDLSSGGVSFTQFCDGPLGPITSLYLYPPASEEDNTSIVFAGDSLGRLSAYIWHFPPEMKVSSFIQIDDPSLQSISAISCNEYVLAVGTSYGVTRIYDTISLVLLRVLSGSKSRAGAGELAVRNIHLESNLLIISIGDKVMAWVPEPLRSHKTSSSSKKSVRPRNAKWHKRIELAQDVTESRQAAAEVAKTGQRSYQRQRDQLSALDGLGLSEHEALEYVLMLSRDEEEQRRVQSDEGVFGMEFDGIPNEVDTLDVSGSHSSGSHPSYPPSPPQPCAPRLVGTPSSSNEKVQVTPPFRPEPMEAGFSSNNFELNTIHGKHGNGNSVPLELENDDHFPVIGSPGSSVSSTAARKTPPSVARSWSDSLKNASPLRDRLRMTSAMGETSIQSTDSHSPAGSYQSTQVFDAVAGEQYVDDMDEDLKLALELSLAEALSLEDSRK